MWVYDWEQRQNPGFGLLAAQLWGFCRPGGYCCFIFIGTEAEDGTLITLNTVEVAHHRGEETGGQAREAAKERKEIQDVYFFYDIFCLLSRGSDASQERQTPAQTQHDILFLLQLRTTINVKSSPSVLLSFLSSPHIFPPSFLLPLSLTHETCGWFSEAAGELQACLLAVFQEADIR